MVVNYPDFEVKIADCAHEVRLAQRLRFAVFAQELGANGGGVDATNQIEADRYDLQADHLMLIDKRQSWNEGVVGTYRLIPQERVERAVGYYSAQEFCLNRLQTGGRSLLELGRSCLHKDYRGGTAMFELWAGLAEYIATNGHEILFGVASFPGIDVRKLAAPLAYLHYNHLAPPALRPIAMGEQACRMDLCGPDSFDPREAILAMPALIKAYLRLGGVVGQGAWVDTRFNTTDVCMVLDAANIAPALRTRYQRERLSA